jgi:2-methylisocitrate lyase-like PEP mutase family enzyme
MLKAAGVRRISLGARMFRAISKDIENKARMIQEEHFFEQLF